MKRRCPGSSAGTGTPSIVAPVTATTHLRACDQRDGQIRVDLPDLGLSVLLTDRIAVVVHRNLTRTGDHPSGEGDRVAAAVDGQ